MYDIGDLVLFDDGFFGLITSITTDNNNTVWYTLVFDDGSTNKYCEENFVLFMELYSKFKIIKGCTLPEDLFNL